jgi:hypothetical protein
VARAAGPAITAGTASVGNLLDAGLDFDLLNNNRRSMRRRHQRCCERQG